MLNATVKKPIIKKHVSTKHIKRSPEYFNDIVYEETQSLLYLQQYYDLRENVFKKVWNLENYSGQPDEYDAISDIIIARKGKKCIGGARITVSTPENRILLPMEGDDFLLREQANDAFQKEFQNLDLTKIKYGEISRLALLQNDFHSCTIGLYNKMLEHCLSRGINCVVSIAPMQQSRSVRIFLQKLGLKVKIFQDLDFPQRSCYEGIKMYLSVAVYDRHQ